MADNAVPIDMARVASTQTNIVTTGVSLILFGTGLALCALGILCRGCARPTRRVARCEASSKKAAGGHQLEDEIESDEEDAEPVPSRRKKRVVCRGAPSLSSIRRARMASRHSQEDVEECCSQLDDDPREVQRSNGEPRERQHRHAVRTSRPKRTMCPSVRLSSWKASRTGRSRTRTSSCADSRENSVGGYDEGPERQGLVMATGVLWKL